MMETSREAVSAPVAGSPLASGFWGTPELDLTNHVVQKEPHMSAAGGYCDVMTGYISPECIHHAPILIKDGKVKVAIKRLRSNLSVNEKFEKSLRREINIWSKLDHPNILPFLGFLLENGFPSLISEWMEHGTAREFVKKYPECDIVPLIRGIAEGLKYMHDQELVHSDLKAPKDNVLISPSRVPMICDFGISRMLDSARSDFVSTTHDGNPRGTIRWMAVELLVPQKGMEPKHSKATDVWAYGMTIYELESKGLPYAHLMYDAQVILALERGQLPDLSGLRLRLVRICEACWALDPRERLTVAEIFPYFNDTLEQRTLQKSHSQTGSLEPKLGRIAVIQGALRNGVTNPAMIQMNRQLELLNRAQKQQPQNGPTNFGQPGPSFRGQQSFPFSFRPISVKCRLAATQGPQQLPVSSGGSAMSPMGFPNSSQQQQAGQQQVQSPQSWMSQMNNINLPNQPAGALPMNQQMHNGSSQNGPAQTPQQHANSPFHTNIGQTQQQQTPIPRSGPTPQQQMLQTFLQQNGSHSSPPSSAPGVLPGQGKFGQQGSALEIQEAQHRPNSLSFPPLARDRFMGLLTEWWKRSGISFDPRTMTIGNRHIDVNQLYQLHTEVLQLGGVVNVQQHGLWNVIAAKMGWTQAAINESGHTQDQIAEQIKLVYERLLQSFEQTYMAAAMKQSLTAPPQQQQQPPDRQPAPSQPSSASGQSSNQLSQQQAVQMIKLANMSAEQLRANGYPENLIQNVVRCRPQLEATWRRMQMQRIQAATQQQQLPQQQQQQLPQQQQQLQLQQQGALLNAPLPFHNQLQAQSALYKPFTPATQESAPNNGGDPSRAASPIPPQLLPSFLKRTREEHPNDGEGFAVLSGEAAVETPWKRIRTE